MSKATRIYIDLSSFQLQLSYNNNINYKKHTTTATPAQLLSIILSFSSYPSPRLHLQVSRRSHEPVRWESSQHSLEAIPGATSQPSYRGPPRGWTSHHIHRSLERHADQAAMDCKYTRDAWHPVVPLFHSLLLSSKLFLLLLIRYYNILFTKLINGISEKLQHY